MQKFAAYEAIASSLNDDLYGERVRLEPRADGEFAKVGVDASRPALECVAIVDFEPKVLKTRNSGRFDADVSDVIGEKIHVSVQERLVPYALRSGDLIHLLDRAEPYPSVAAVSTVEPDGIGRILLRCKPSKARP
ncbi:hypothetical protein [Bosea sp. (in: a-proteobacteria)]|uniref:hypothetical protein n=1 Tax=Bosea sp. (in: a-proteobacteria) TaxID=1871050 RepID=UPI001ACEBB03|nr:hypothetical protein [Bosea sp. (in: a-proteobacteria)]MBN9444377.1 hypothetical protein [Bosea sp. (in: a-proteobacteria)]